MLLLLSQAAQLQNRGAYLPYPYLPLQIPSESSTLKIFLSVWYFHAHCYNSGPGKQYPTPRYLLIPPNRFLQLLAHAFPAFLYLKARLISSGTTLTCDHVTVALKTQ